jgi:hypothetical protein
MIPLDSLRSSVALDYIQQQSAEIERLRASLIDLHAEYTICIDIHSSFHRSH